MERRRNKRGSGRGELARGPETRVQVIFYLIVEERRMGRVESAERRAGRSKANRE